MIKIVRVPFDKPGNPCRLMIPKDSRILAVEMESWWLTTNVTVLNEARPRLMPFAWVEVDTDKPMAEQWFHMVMFDEPLPASCQLGKYISAIRLPGSEVLHVYAVESPF